jgi:uncharacterized protein (DUF433 family)
MVKQYVEKHEDNYWVADTRISLDSVVINFLHGLSPETIATECFHALTLEQVYGAITYYLAHRAEIDEYLQQADVEFISLREEAQKADPEFARKLATMRRQIQMTH